MSVAVPNSDTYKRVNVETASQGKLVVMLLNGAVQRAEEAKRQLEKGRIDGAHNNLIRAQEILGELRSALNMRAGGAIAANLDRVYEYLQHLLIKANVNKTTAPIDECIQHIIPLRDTWQQAFDLVAKEQAATPPQVNAHGNAVINMQG